MDCTTAESSQKTLTACEEQLIQTPLAGWVDFIEENKSKFNLMDAHSIQAFIDELSAAYGEGDAKLGQDLTLTGGELFGLLISHTKKKGPNRRQFAMGQYIVGQLTKRQRQLWSVPGGQGKSRIAAIIAAIAFLTGIVVKIYIVHETEQLMMRDKESFQMYWTLLGCGEDAIEYIVGLDFDPEANSLIVFDEADRFTLIDTEKFAALINSCFCVCLTATPDDGDSKGAQRAVVDTLKFSRYNYVTDAPKFQKIKLDVDEVVVAAESEEKTEYIVQLLSNGPVLVFCENDLAEQLVERMTTAERADAVICMSTKTDYKSLLCLDQKPFKLVIATEEFAMRGIDYRCEKATMTVVIGKPFSCTVQARQGLDRVGRFDDPCKRT